MPTGLFNDFSDLLPDTVTVAHVTSKNGYGEPTYGSNSSYLGRFMQKTQVIFKNTSEEFVSPYQVIIAGTAAPSIVLGDKVTCPDGTQRPVRVIKVFRDENNTYHHTTLWMQ